MTDRTANLGVVWEQANWMREGLCMQTDPDAFYPEKGMSTAEAKRVCQVCPVRAECLEYAVARNERFGVWGGHSARERRLLVQARRADATAGQVAADGQAAA